MEAEFWLQKWAKNEIGFHGKVPHPLLVKHFDSLSLPNNSRIFLPLCGKTLDIAWLLSKGFSVVGVELSAEAIKQLFNELSLTPNISTVGKLNLYQSKNLTIFVGDIFDLSTEMLGHVHAIYDRAALVALPETMRIKYASHLRQITSAAPQLLVTFTYDQSLKKGPPFSITQFELEKHYSHFYEIKLLETINVQGGLKGNIEAKENIWLLKKTKLT